MTGVAWLLVVLWATWALIRLFGLERGFPLVPMIAFTPYVGLASVIPIGVALALRRRAAAIAALAVAVLFAALILPRAFGGGGAEVQDGVTLRVMSANMKLGEGDAAALAQLCEELDVEVLSVQELTADLARELRSELGASLGHSALITDLGSGGSGIWADRPLRVSSPPAEMPGGFALPRATLSVAGAGPVEVLDVHAQPPTGPIATALWEDDLSSLPAAERSPLRLLLGDFNATLDQAELRDVIDRGYTDAADAVGAGLTATWPEHRRFPPLFAIDHVIVDERIGVEEVSVHEIPRSDHRAVFAELTLPAAE